MKKTIFDRTKILFVFQWPKSTTRSKSFSNIQKISDCLILYEHNFYMWDYSTIRRSLLFFFRNGIQLTHLHPLFTLRTFAVIFRRRITLFKTSKRESRIYRIDTIIIFYIFLNRSIVFNFKAIKRRSRFKLSKKELKNHFAKSKFIWVTPILGVHKFFIKK